MGYFCPSFTYHFNSNGNVVDVNDEMWYTSGTKIDLCIENTPSSQGRVRRAVVNRLVNTDFTSGWTQTKEYGSDTYSIDSSVTCLAMKSAKVVKKGAGEFKSTSQAKLFKSGKYTFSVYVKTTGLTVADGKKGAFLRVTDGTNVYIRVTVPLIYDSSIGNTYKSSAHSFALWATSVPHSPTTSIPMETW